MKIPSDIVKAARPAPEDARIRQQRVPEEAGTTADSLRLSRDRIRRVTEENRRAAATDMLDFKKAEHTVSALGQRLLQDGAAAAALHRLGDRQVLFLLLG